MKRSIILSLACFGVFACSEPPPPTPVTTFLDDDVLLDQVLLRCSQDPGARKTDQECVNARRAIDVLAAREEEARRQQLEAESERKREALRRQKEREQQRVAEVEAMVAQEAAQQEAAETIGDSSYAVTPSATLPATTPPGMAGSTSDQSQNVRAAQPLQPDLCRLDPSAMSDDDLIAAYNAMQAELQRRQAPAPSADMGNEAPTSGEATAVPPPTPATDDGG